MEDGKMVEPQKVDAPVRPDIDLAKLPNATIGDIYVENPRMTARQVRVNYGDKTAIEDVSLDIGGSEVISFIGPSGCGKSTFLRCLNRMNDTIKPAKCLVTYA